MPEPSPLLAECIKLARKASDAVMEIYNSDDFDIKTKEDNSPVTKADKLANKIIEAGLKQISNYPIISEEGNHEASANSFWLVDPVDGTKGFVARNDEFTVNIGLVKNGRPALGVVSAPAKNLLYYGGKNLGAFKQIGGDEPARITANYKGKIPLVFASRRHRGEALENFLVELGEHEETSMDSSLKFCLLAEGAAALYPRFAPCMLWDTAAAEAILVAAGGQIVRANDGQQLAYDPGQLENPFFIATAANYVVDASKR